MSNYNTLTIQIVSISNNCIKYFLFADALNEITRPHTYFFNTNNPSVDQVQYSKLKVGDKYVITCLKQDDLWVWIKGHNITRCVD